MSRDAAKHGAAPESALARRRLLRQHALAGVSFTSPDTVTIDAGVEIGEDTTVGPGVSLHGATRVGRFGWKGGVPDLAQFSADAYLNEMGITTSSCSRCQAAIVGISNM